jgi:hypothetical protein
MSKRGWHAYIDEDEPAARYRRQSRHGKTKILWSELNPAARMKWRKRLREKKEKERNVTVGL